ncbi:MAG: CHAD domain-containing protein [Candidatus Binatia bacterium]
MNGEAAPMLDRPVRDAVGALILRYLGTGAAALERTKDRGDSEALHDLRVALRRTRSLLRAYRPWLGRAAGRKLRRRLDKLAAATNVGRDAEVQLAWLESRRESLRRGERSGLNWLVRRRRAARREGYDSARRHGREEFDQLAARLGERLREGSKNSPPLREALAPLVRDHAADLEAALSAIGSADDQTAVHAARIRAKRLRYLVEPLKGESTQARNVVRMLKGLQDLLGDLHDMHVLAVQLSADLDEVATTKAHQLRDLSLGGDHAGLLRERRRDERLGLLALMAQAQARRDELFAGFEGTWRGEKAGALIHAARQLADRLAPAASSVPVERERKFLLTGLPPAVREAPVQEIRQGWLPGVTLRERLRQVRDAAGEHYFRTVKLGRGIERIEIEEETTPEVFEAMWPLTAGCRIEKRRYLVVEGELTWEIDEFLDRDLVLAEVELDTVDQDVPMPDWLTAVLVREVTDDPNYLNLTLATRAA